MTDTTPVDPLPGQLTFDDLEPAGPPPLAPGSTPADPRYYLNTFDEDAAEGEPADAP